MYVRSTRYKGRGIGSFLRRVARKGIQKLRSPGVKKLFKTALKSTVVKSAVEQGVAQVIDTIASSKTAQKVLSNPTVENISKSPVVKKVISEIAASEPVKKVVNKIERTTNPTVKNLLKDISRSKPIQKAIKDITKKQNKKGKKVLRDISSMLTKPKSTNLKGWRKVSGKGIVRD